MSHVNQPKISTADPAGLSPLPETVAPPATRGKRAIDTSALMALAAVLIVNSHLEQFYPRAFLAADGLLGVFIFFLLSGFGLQMSALAQPRSFWSYAGRRLARIYPTLLICEFVFLAIDGTLWTHWSVYGFITKFIYHTDFTFVEDILPFYLLMYPLLVARSARVYAAAMGITAIVYLCFYIPDARQIPAHWHLSMGERPGYMHDAAYFEVMLLGGWFALNQKRLGTSGNFKHLCTCLVILVYFGIKFAMVVRGYFAAFYGVLHLLTLIASACLLISFTDKKFLAAYHRSGLLGIFIALIGALTFEIYLVHSYLIEYQWLIHIRFPLNIFVLGVITLAISWLLAEIVKPINKLLSGGKPKRSHHAAGPT